MKLGRIGYINCYPVYGAIDRGVVRVPAELVTGTPAELNDLLTAGELDVSVISAVEYARHAKDLVLLPDLAISCDGPVRSVALFSKRPVAELDGRTVLLTASSRTSVGLLELLCRDRWHVAPRFAQARAEATDLDALAHLPHGPRDGRVSPARCAGFTAASSPRATGDWHTWTCWPPTPRGRPAWGSRRAASTWRGSITRSATSTWRVSPISSGGSPPRASCPTAHCNSCTWPDHGRPHDA